MGNTQYLAEDIDGVIRRLDEVIEQSLAEGSRLALFACLYRAVTQRVKESILAGRFEDGRRMERLDVIFANRYLAAYDAYRRGDPCCQSWMAAFDAGRAWSPIILQHLLLGINAHINFDLGIAAAQTAPGATLPGFKRDFDEISRLLGEMLDDVQDRIAAVSPWMGLLDRVGARVDETICTFCLSASRDLAWEAAQRFAVLPAERHDEELDRLDRRVAALARSIRNPGLYISAALLIVRLRETHTLERVVEALTGTHHTALVAA